MKEMVGGCCVCSDERGWAENPLVYCDGAGCSVAVHQACYGIISVPTGPWFCRKCESQERTARVKCELCPLKEGALKRTDTGAWCHVVCALFIPEAWFGNVQTMEPIILKGLPPERFNKPCYICEEQNRAAKATGGACMQCNKNGCKHYFHVTCAQAQGLLCEEAGTFMDNVKYCGYCAYHYKKLKKDSHIKVIPPFRPVVNEHGTPQSTPEKIIASKAEKGDKKAPSSMAASQNMTMPKTEKMLAFIAECADVEQSKGRSSAPHNSPPHSPSSSSSSESDSESYRSPQSNKSTDRITDIKATGKFTTANFTETTITPSPANFADLASPSHETEKSSGGEKTTGEKANASDSGMSSTMNSDCGETDKSTADRHKSTADSVINAVAAGETDKAMPTLTKTVVDKSPVTSVKPPTSSSYNYNYESFAGKNDTGSASQDGSRKKEGGTDNVPVKRARSRSSDKLDKKRNKKTKPVTNPTKTKDTPTSKPQTPPTRPQAQPTKQQAPPNRQQTPPTKQQTPPSRPQAPPSRPQAPPTRPAHPSSSPTHSMDIGEEPKKKSKKDGPMGFGMCGAPSFGTTAVSMASIQRQVGARSEERSKQHSLPPSAATPPPPGLVPEAPPTSNAGASSGSQELDGAANGPSSLIGPPLTSKALTSVTSPLRVDSNHISGQLPTSMEQLLERQWDQGSHFLMEQGQHFDIASLLSCLHQLRQENQRLEEHIASLSARRDQLLAVNARLSLPLTPLLHSSQASGASEAPAPITSRTQDGVAYQASRGMEGAGSHSGRSHEGSHRRSQEGAGSHAGQSQEGAGSHGRSHEGAGSHRRSQEGVGSHVGQGQEGSHSGRSHEGAGSHGRSHEGAGSHSGRGQEGAGSHGRSHEGAGSHSGRSPRLNNYLPPESASAPQDLREVLSRSSTNRSPAQGHSPAHSHLSTPTTTQSPLLSGGHSGQTSTSRSHTSRDPPVLTAAVPPALASTLPPSSLPSEAQLADHQRMILQQQQQQLLLGAHLPEIQQHLMLQMLHQHQVAAAANNSMATNPPPSSSSSQAPPTKPHSDKSKDKS